MSEVVECGRRNGQSRKTKKIISSVLFEALVYITNNFNALYMFINKKVILKIDYS